MLKHRKFHIIKEPAYCRLTSYDNVIKTSTYTFVYTLSEVTFYIYTRCQLMTLLSSVIAVSCIHIIVPIFSVGASLLVRVREYYGDESLVNIQSFKM